MEKDSTPLSTVSLCESGSYNTGAVEDRSANCSRLGRIGRKIVRKEGSSCQTHPNGNVIREDVMHEKACVFRCCKWLVADYECAVRKNQQVGTAVSDERVGSNASKHGLELLERCLRFVNHKRLSR